MSAPIVRQLAGPGREQPDPYFAQVIGKAFKILETLRRSGEPAALNEVALKLGGAKSSVFRILHTLQALGYIEKDPLGRYALSAELRTSERAPFLANLMHAGLEKLKELNREARETASLAALFDNHIEVVGVVESPHIIRMSNMVGRILPPHASSLGKSIAAFQPEDRRERLVRAYGIYRYTEYTLTDESELKREFERIRAAGFSVDREENVLGGICFAAPVFAGGPNAVGAVSVSTPKMRVEGGTEEKLILLVRKAAREVSDHLGRTSEI